jgi:hypothetical protein
MKKALHQQQRAFLYIKDGKVHPEETSIEEIIAAINRGINGEWGNSEPETVILRKLHEWICRYIEEGETEEFLNELNFNLRDVQYLQHVVPSDFYSPHGDGPQSIYVVNMDINYTFEAFAAKEFSRFITYGLLNRVKRCHSPRCENIYTGPPQSKWCSEKCGSQYRVSKKRKRDSQ